MASERNGFNEEERMNPLSSGGGGGGVRSNRSGGRRNNGKEPKKAPQRGLGVEQLERLRMEESLRKAAEASGIPNFHYHDQQQQHHNQFFQFYPPQQVFGGGSVPVRYGAGTPSGGSNGFQIQCPNQQMFGPFIGNKNGVTIGSCSSSSTMSGWLMQPNHNINQHNRVTNFSFGSGPLGRNSLEPSKELTSMPNQPFDFCLKKTRLCEENVHGSNGRRDLSNNFYDFFGCVPKPAASSYATPKPDHENVEVVAVHRRGDSESGRVFMEYEFFPGKYGRCTTSKVLELPTIGSVEEVGGGGSSEASSSITFTAYGDTTTASNSLDLSLKL